MGLDPICAMRKNEKRNIMLHGSITSYLHGSETSCSTAASCLSFDCRVKVGGVSGARSTCSPKP